MSLNSQILAKLAQGRGLDKDPEKLAIATNIIKNADRNFTQALSELNALGSYDVGKTIERNFDQLKNSDSGLSGKSRLKFDQNLRNFWKANATGIEKEVQESIYAGFYSSFKDITTEVDPQFRDEAIINFLGLDDGDIESAYRIWVDANEDFVNELIDYYSKKTTTDKLSFKDGNTQDVDSPPFFRVSSVLTNENKKRIANAKRKNTWRLKRINKK